MAKDVTEFLNWAAEPEMDQRKKMGWKVIAITSVLYALSIWVKKYVNFIYFFPHKNPPSLDTYIIFFLFWFGVFRMREKEID